MRAEVQARRTDSEQARFEELRARTSRTDVEEVEYLNLSWFTDHADRRHAWELARSSARKFHPINWVMNAQLNVDKKLYRLEDDIVRVREVLPPGSAIIGGQEDPRPAACLRYLAAELGCDVTIIPGAGHYPRMERPAEFAAALRDPVARQGDPAG